MCLADTTMDLNSLFEPFLRTFVFSCEQRGADFVLLSFFWGGGGVSFQDGCYKNCPAKTYSVDEDMTCVPCDENCVSCDEHECYWCEADLFLSGRTTIIRPLRLLFQSASPESHFTPQRGPVFRCVLMVSTATKTPTTARNVTPTARGATGRRTATASRARTGRLPKMEDVRPTRRTVP